MHHHLISRQAEQIAIIAVVAVIGFLLPAVVTADPAAKTDVSARLVYVERLLTESSAARKVDESGDPDAISLKAEARSHFDKAKELAEAGDAAVAEVELGEAIRMFSAAAKSANGDVKVSKKQSDDYQSRRESVLALAAAHDRIAKEKGEKGMNKTLQAEVEGEVMAADALLEQINVLLAEKMESSPMRATAEKLISNAEELRGKAEAAAGKQRYEEAIELLEQSTKELIRAIRSAGVYIPG